MITKIQIAPGEIFIHEEVWDKYKEILKKINDLKEGDVIHLIKDIDATFVDESKVIKTEPLTIREGSSKVKRNEL